MSRYPSELACVVMTKAGEAVHVRPIRPGDGPGLAQFHQHLSLRSAYRRFFFVHPVLSAPEIERFTTVDYVDRLALVVDEGQELLAVGRYDRCPGTGEAEVAFVVADLYQNHGIGTLLLEQLAAAAWRNGITTFTASVLPENREMLGVFTDSGFQATTHSEDGIIGVRFSIEPDDAYRSVCAARHAGNRPMGRLLPDAAPC
jgi:GNAT superfamily N-acetyltransferase